MRTITLIIVHCSANRAGSALRMADIDSYHRSLGWIGCGYHYVIPTDGTIEPGRPDEMVGAHCKNHNRHSIGVITGIRLESVTSADCLRTESLLTPERMPNALPCATCWNSFTGDIPTP